VTIDFVDTKSASAFDRALRRVLRHFFFAADSRLQQTKHAATSAPNVSSSAAPQVGHVVIAAGRLALRKHSVAEVAACFGLLQAGIAAKKKWRKTRRRALSRRHRAFGVYEIDCHADGSLCELGRGAMGVTYRATDSSLQRKVALKIIKTDIAERSADARERFVASARAAAALRHEHIATVYQFGMRLETGQYFYAMDDRGRDP